MTCKFLPVTDLLLNELPSRGLLYSDDTTLSYTPFTYGELLKYSQSFMNVKKKYMFLMDKIAATNMDKYHITLADFYYISLLINLSTFDTFSFKVTKACKQCDVKIEKTVSSKELEFDELQDNKSQAKISINEKQLLFTPITVSDFFNLFDMGKHKEQEYLFAAQCRTVDIELEELANYVKDCTPTDSEAFDIIDTTFYHGVTPLKVTCDECNTENTLHLEGGVENWISPFRRDDKLTRDQIHFS